jgi:transposase
LGAGVTVYDYTPDRSRDGPARWLAGFTGYLQADAYGGYDGIFAGGGVTEVACWGPRAPQVLLALIGELYAIEREAKDADDATRLALRQERSVSVLARIKDWRVLHRVNISSTILWRR